MALMEKTARSLRGGFLIIKSSPVFLYTMLSIVAMYVVNFNYIIIVGNIGESLALSFLNSFFACAMAFLIIGAFLSERLKLRAHLIWNLLGIIFGIALMLPIGSTTGLILYSILGGVATGLGIPRAVTLVINRTTFENRGGVSGVFTAMVYVLIIGCSFFINTAVQMGMFLVLIKLINMFIAFKTDFTKTPPAEGPFVRFGANIKFSFCFLWFIFLLVDALLSISGRLVMGYELVVLRTASMLVGLASMPLVGALMDEIGRKKLLVFCYAYLGFEYALITLSGGYLIRYTYLDGIAWGILTVFFIMVLVGDIIFPQGRPLFLSIMMSIAFLGSYVRDTLLASNIVFYPQQIFTITSVFLFVAVVVMLFLPETLPDKVLQKKELQDYLQRAKKVREKYQ